MGKKILRILGIIAILIVAAAIGYALIKFTLGIMAALLVVIGIFLGYYFCVVFPPKSLKKRINPEKYKNK